MMQMHFGILERVLEFSISSLGPGILAMEERNGFSRQGSGLWRSLTDGDFEEEDVWEVLHERRDYAPKLGEYLDSPVCVKRHLPSAARMVPRRAITTPSFDGGSTSSSGEPTSGIKQQSAPVKIPDWSKVSDKKSTKASSRNGSWAWHGDDDDASGYKGDEAVIGHGNGQPEIDYDDDDDDDDGYDSKVPPHEIVARRLARSQISSFSVLEGVGRKLKGRDLRKVRNAVLTKTGFLE